MPAPFQRARSEEQRSVRRQAILDTAAQMLADMPVAEVSLNALSRRVCLAKSNVLRYFESREEILLELLDTESRAWLDDLAETLPAAVGAADPAAGAADSGAAGDSRGAGGAGTSAPTGEASGAGGDAGANAGAGGDANELHGAAVPAGRGSSTAVDDDSPMARGDRLSAALATSLAGRPVLCDLASAQAAVLERNVSPQVALAYKRATIENAQVLAGLVRRCVPELGAWDALRFAGVVMMTAGSVWTHAHPSAAMQAAYDADPGLAALRLDFTDTLRQLLEVFVAGLLARTADGGEEPDPGTAGDLFYQAVTGGAPGGRRR